MKQRRSRKQPNRSRSDIPFFASTNREQVPRSGTPFFHRADVARQSPDKEEETASQSKEQDEETSQSVDDRELARQGEREDEAVAEDAKREEETTAQDAVEREDESAAQESGEREEETATQDSGEREEETVAQDAEEHEEITGQDAEREEEMVAQAITVSRRSDTQMSSRRRLHSRAGQPARGGTTPDVQRTLGDGHDLTTSRFAGNLRLEAAFDDERYVRRGARGDHVVRLQQALVELGFQLPGVGVDGRFGPETEQAVRDYQAANGLQVDGIVGPRTMGALDSRLFIPSLNWPNSLRDQIRQMFAQGQTYAQMRPVIRGAS
ncbi:MAG: peptidoglycan-binding protein, partial [Candidatus Paceibacterota bacterium]